MSENADPQAAETTENSTPQGPRMRFPVIVVLLQLAVTYTVYALASTNMQIIIGMGLPPVVALSRGSH